MGPWCVFQKVTFRSVRPFGVFTLIVSCHSVAVRYPSPYLYLSGLAGSSKVSSQALPVLGLLTVQVQPRCSLCPIEGNGLPKNVAPEKFNPSALRTCAS